jgi:hypothetical protein
MNRSRNAWLQNYNTIILSPYAGLCRNFIKIDSKTWLNSDCPTSSTLFDFQVRSKSHDMSSCRSERSGGKIGSLCNSSFRNIERDILQHSQITIKNPSSRARRNEKKTNDFHEVLKIFIYHVFHITNHFRKFPLKQIQDWNELNRLYFHLFHLNQMWFHEVFKFFIYHVLRDVNHFYQFRLNQIQYWNQLKQKNCHHPHFNQLWFHEVWNSSMVLRSLVWTWDRSWLEQEIIFSKWNMNFRLILYITNWFREGIT